MDDMLRTNLIHHLSNLLKKYAQTLVILEHILNVNGKCLVTTLAKIWNPEIFQSINGLVEPRDPIIIYQKVYDTHPHRASPRITHQRHAKDGPLFLKLFVLIHQVFLVWVNWFCAIIISTILKIAITIQLNVPVPL
jgi:hypothetical protein